MLYRTTWYVTEDYFTRQLHFTLKPYVEEYIVVWQWQRLPGNTMPTQDKNNNVVHYDAQNVPGIDKEEFMPPDDSIEGKLDLFYTMSDTRDPVKFWKKAGKDWNGQIEQFVGHNSAIRNEADKIAPTSDPPATRPRKLYARAQRIRSLTFEPDKTAEEIKAEKLKDNKNAEDVLKNGYGDYGDVDQFFIALARAAGFTASAVYISDRDRYFFSPRILDTRQFVDEVVDVNMNGQDMYLDPGTPHCGFGNLPWPETGVQGIKLDGSGGTFVTTTLPKSSDATISRTATLQMGDDAWLHGKLVITYSGQEALERRHDANNQDAADRKKSLTDEVSGWLAAGAAVTLTNQPDWAGSDTPLVAEFDVRTHVVGSNSGHLALLSENFFSDGDLPRFDHPERTYAIYFDYPWEFHDDVTLTLPLTLEAGDLPTPVNRSSPFGIYQLSCTKEPGALHFQRAVTLGGIYYDLQYYGAIRSFFDEARNADKQQVMLHVAGAPETQARH